MIEAGTAADIRWGSGDWVFLDIGFSSERASCGILVREEKPECLTFANAKAKLIQEANKVSELNLVIEAPLSVCFGSSGNPIGRRIEKKDSQLRYWYTGAGSAMMVASMYLLRELYEKKASIRLFEGLVSYKPKALSDHKRDVRALQATVRDPDLGVIYGLNDLKRPDDRLFSAFLVAGFDCGVPAVIEPNEGCLESANRGPLTHWKE